MPTDYADRFNRVLLFIQSHLDEGLETDRLAQVAALSPFHFHRVFRAITGETVGQVVRRLRLERAAVRLRSGMSVTEAALEAGFGSPEAFSRAFRRGFKLLPSAFVDRPDIPTDIRAPLGLHWREGDPQPLSKFHIPEKTTMQYEIQDLPAAQAAAVKYIGPYGPQIGASFEMLGAWAIRHPTLTEKGRVMAIYNNSPQDTPEDDLDTDVAVALAPGVEVQELPEAVRLIDIPGGRHLVHRHVGPYEQLAFVWPRLMRDVVAARGIGLANRAPFDWYRNDPREVPPADLITDICLPLAE